MFKFVLFDRSSMICRWFFVNEVHHDELSGLVMITVKIKWEKHEQVKYVTI